MNSQKPKSRYLCVVTRRASKTIKEIFVNTPTKDYLSRANVDEIIIESIEYIKLGLTDYLEKNLAKCRMHLTKMDLALLLYTSCVYGEKDSTLLLLKNNAPGDVAGCQDESAVHAAVRCQSVPCLQILLDFRTNINLISHSDKRTALHVAASMGNDQIVVFLINQGAIVNYEDIYGMTPLHLAVFKNHLTTVRLLLASGGDVNATNKEGWTCLHEAACSGHESIVQLLLDHGAYPGKFNKYGRSPLYWAAHNGHTRLAQILMERTDISDLTTVLHAR